MDITPEKRTGPYYQTHTIRNRQILLVIIGIVIFGAAGWWLYNQPHTTEVEIELISTLKIPTQESANTEINEFPLTPIELPIRNDASSTTEIAAAPLPSLDNSDAFVRTQLLELNNAQSVQQWLSTDNLMRRGTILIDGLTHGSLQRKFLPIPAPSGQFLTVKKEQRYWLSTSNYQRYDRLIQLITAADPQQVANTIHYLRPLFEQAFGEQGYNDKDFGSTLLLAINQILAAPTYEQPPELKLESVYYKFVDPVIEKMSDIQKQLIRTGPDNTRRIQAYLQQLHAALLRQE